MVVVVVNKLHLIFTSTSPLAVIHFPLEAFPSASFSTKYTHPHTRADASSFLLAPSLLTPVAFRRSLLIQHLSMGGVGYSGIG
jgi:hypothetical protein